MNVDRESLIRALEAVRPGLAKKEIVQQSSCFVFNEDGRLMTFDDEVACSVESPLNGIVGAVKADPLLALLARLPEDRVDVDAKDGGLLVKGKRRRGSVTMEEEVVLPVGDVPEPTDWQPLPEDFDEAVAIVQATAGKDASQFYLTCINITPTCLEACDNFQICRYPMETGVSAPLLVRRDSLVHVCGLGMTEMSEGDSWLHFRNSSGLTLSCRTNRDEPYPTETITAILDVNGDRTLLPDGLADAVERAEVFSQDNVEANQVQVELKPGKLRLSGRGASGWYEEMREAKYDGEPLKFLIAPGLLRELIARTNECEITPGRLKIDGQRFQYVACLGAVG